MRLSAGASSCALCGPGFFSNSTGCNSTFLILKSSFVGFARHDMHVVGRVVGWQAPRRVLVLHALAAHTVLQVRVPVFTMLSLALPALRV